MLYIFDMGGVVTNSAVLDDKLSKVLGISVEEFERICGKKTDGANKGQLESLGLFSLCSDGIIDTNEFWAEFSKRSGIAVKTDSGWIDITGSAFSKFQFSITFHSDGTYYGKGYFGTGGGTYKAFGKTIETYVDGELYYTYHVNSMTSNQAELTMSAKGSSMEIRVQKK